MVVARGSRHNRLANHDDTFRPMCPRPVLVLRLNGRALNTKNLPRKLLDMLTKRTGVFLVTWRA
jgi:hypothetical protein